MIGVWGCFVRFWYCRRLVQSGIAEHGERATVGRWALWPKYSQWYVCSQNSWPCCMNWDPALLVVCLVDPLHVCSRWVSLIIPIASCVVLCTSRTLVTLTQLSQVFCVFTNCLTSPMLWGGYLTPNSLSVPSRYLKMPSSCLALFLPDSTLCIQSCVHLVWVTLSAPGYL